MTSATWMPVLIAAAAFVPVSIHSEARAATLRFVDFGRIAWLYLYLPEVILRFANPSADRLIALLQELKGVGSELTPDTTGWRCPPNCICISCWNSGIRERSVKPAPYDHFPPTRFAKQRALRMISPSRPRVEAMSPATSGVMIIYLVVRSSPQHVGVKTCLPKPK